MTGLLLIAIGVLLSLCASLVLLLVGRDRAARKTEARLADRWANERQKVRHLTDRVTEYRAELARLSADRGQQDDTGIPADWQDTALDIARAVSPADFEPGETR